MPQCADGVDRGEKVKNCWCDRQSPLLIMMMITMILPMMVIMITMPMMMDGFSGNDADDNACHGDDELESSYWTTKWYDDN